MEEILASIRRIIAEDEAGRARGTAQPAPRAFDSPSRTPRPAPAEPAPVMRAASPTAAPAMAAPAMPAPAFAAARAPVGADADAVLDLTNMVAADGSVVTIAPRSRGGPPVAPASSTAENQTVAYGGFSRRPPPPGPGAEPRPAAFGHPAAIPSPSASDAGPIDPPSRNPLSAPPAAAAGRVHGCDQG